MFNKKQTFIHGENTKSFVHTSSVINVVYEHQENTWPFQRMNPDLRRNEMNLLIEYHLMIVDLFSVFEQVLYLLEHSIVLHLFVRLFQHVLKRRENKFIDLSLISSSDHDDDNFLPLLISSF